MIDIHNHILPQVDDGARDLEESLAMAKMAEKDGIRHIIATPHLLDPGISREAIADKTAALNEALRAGGLSVRVHPGAEIPIHLLDMPRWRIGLAASRFLLVEFPPDTILPGAAELFRGLIRQGHKIIIAHPERNLAAMQKPERLLDLLEPGVSVQITAGSLTGDMGKTAQSLARHLLSLQQVAYIASDAHNAHTRPPVLSKALAAAARWLKQPADRLATENPRQILDAA